MAANDAIIAIVNDEVITLSDLKKYISATATQLRLEGRTKEQISSILPKLEVNGLQRLIEDKLILDAANSQELEVNPEMVDKRYEDIKSRYPSESKFLESILSAGSTPSDIRNKLIEQLKIEYIINKEIRSKIYVSPPEVTEYYKEHFENYQRKERVNLDSIFVARVEGAKEKAVQALAAIKEGKDFTAVAKEFSEAPSVGIIERGQMIPAIETAVFGLTMNEVSSVLEIDSGFFIFKLTGKSSSDIISLNDIKDKVSNEIHQMKFRKKFAAWVDKLKEDAFIEIK